MVARGDVWWLEAPEHKRRPVLVLTRDAAIPVRRKTCVAPLTTRVRGIPVEVALSRLDDGVTEDCVISLDNVETVPKAFLVEKMTTLSTVRMAEVCAALATAIDC
ncbi:MAG: type II toxin-antitoxin system PemK/MazF family toxin [Egibacteraceae bacterium]